MPCRLLFLSALLGCGSDMAPVMSAVPRFNATLPEETFIERYGLPCHTEPFSTGERWFYCMNAAREIATCTPGCEERAAYAWNGAVSWGP